MIAKKVSDKGTPRIIIGISKDTTAACLNPSIDKVARAKPRNRAPESPINILAG
ncbi:hypothetical protein D3C85_1844380 [compost metagenome]